MSKFALFGTLICLLLGCAESHRYATGCGEGGTLHSGDYGAACSYVVVVTGFECPAAFPNYYEFDGGFVCASEPIDPEELPKEICNTFKGECKPVTTPDGGPPIDGGQDCQETADCPTGQYCRGDCSAPGTCTDIPSEEECEPKCEDPIAACAAEYDYCDCNGTVRTQVFDAPLGGCILERHDPADRSCINAKCQQAADCPAGQYCDGDCSAPGTCRNADRNCDDALTDYCTCDGKLQTSPDSCISEPYYQDPSTGRPFLNMCE